jgi:hypothetical protein
MDGHQLAANDTYGKIFRKTRCKAENDGVDINACDTFSTLYGCFAWFGLSGKIIAGAYDGQYAVCHEKRIIFIPSYSQENADGQRTRKQSDKCPAGCNKNQAA